MNADGDCISLSDCLNLEAMDDLIDFVCDESVGPASPADAAPSVAPEPVAWQMIDKHGDTVYVPVTHAIKPDLVLDCDLRHPDNAPHEQRPLFAHPPRAPLTEEQKRDLVKECDLDWQRGFMPLFDGDPTNRYAVLIEAVEAAHGIGGK